MGNDEANMDHLERLIPLFILATIGAFVLILLRRSPRQTATTQRPPEPLSAIAVRQPAVGTLEVPASKIKRKKLKRKRVPAVTGPAAAPRTPIHTVLGLLRDKDTLAAAFLLREILAPPVSQRR
jgi:hypothetical protein